jgi:iron complex transport system substrate-binding protein
MKKSIIISAVFVLLLTACSGISDSAGSSQSIVLTDSTGHTVVLDGVPERIALAGKATVMVQDTVFLFEEAPVRLIALENRNQSAFSFLPLVDDTFEDKEIFEKNVGPEQIAAVQPDLVIMKSFMAEQLGEPLELLDIPVVYLDLETPEAFYQDVQALGQVFGAENRAQEIVSYYQDRVTLVEEQVSSADTAPSVLILQHSDRDGEVAFKVPPASWLQTRMVEMAGGDPIWKGMEAGEGWTVVNLEQIATWDPDQIYIIDYAGNASSVKEELLENEIWGNLAAVQNDQLFAFGFDIYSWDQPDTRWILGLQWLATKIHPDLTGEIDILEEVNSFYSVLYYMDEATITQEIIPALIGDLP